jgi:hypothetical protein
VLRFLADAEQKMQAIFEISILSANQEAGNHKEINSILYLLILANQFRYYDGE